MAQREVPGREDDSDQDKRTRASEKTKRRKPGKSRTDASENSRSIGPEKRGARLPRREGKSAGA